MSKERECPPDDWTLGTLRRHVIDLMDERDRRYAERFEAQEKAVGAAISAADKAVTKAETSTEKRFDSTNEFRQTLTDQAATFVTKVEYAANYNIMIKDMDLIKSQLTSMQGRAGGLSAGWGYLIGAIGAVGIIVAIFMSVRHVP
jgi:hypothetical protein